MFRNSFQPGYCDFNAGLNLAKVLCYLFERFLIAQVKHLYVCTGLQLIQSGDFNFFNSPSAVASSASSLKQKSMESRSSCAALSKDNHLVLHAFWRCFVTYHLCSGELASGFLEPQCRQRVAKLGSCQKKLP